MPIRVRWKNDPAHECTIRPTPLVSIATEFNTTAAGDMLGATYTITLTGKLLADEGTPYALRNIDGDVYAAHIGGGRYPNLCGPYNTFDNNISHFGNNRPPKQKIDHKQSLNAILMKQRSLRGLFAEHGQRIEITDVEFDLATVVFFPRIRNISFSEGDYVNSCDYSITLEADTMWTYGLVDGDGNRDQSDPMSNAKYGLIEANFLREDDNGYIKDFSESWSIEVDEGQGEVVSFDNTFIPRAYRITHNISANGKDHYMPPANGQVERLKAWEQAKRFVVNRLSFDPAYNNDKFLLDGTYDMTSHGYPNKDPFNQMNLLGMPPNIYGQIGAGTIDLVSAYNGFNHTRTETIDEAGGSYSVVETWLLASGNAYETYNMSVNSSVGDPFVKVSINGNVKGLTLRGANDSRYGGRNGLGDQVGANMPYTNALEHYNSISNNQAFGVGSMIYKRANNQTQVQLNAEPKSISLGQNEYAGTITYALEFDNRPTNIITNTAAETISVNDTYPGDVFATIPVIGRPTGPVLQYIGGRTEYKRDISVNLIMDYTKIPYDSGRPLLLTKPSVSEPTATELAMLLESLSPANEPGVRKYFINAPTESWEPKAGAYNFNISFTYELDK